MYSLRGLFYSSYGAIHSVTHPRPQSSHSPSQLSQQRLGSTLYQHHQLINLPASVKLAALIKGHLCRRLLATSEVQSIVKTIKDCRSLLPARLTAKTSATHSTTQPLMSLQDLNFQERLLDQVSHLFLLSLLMGVKSLIQYNRYHGSLLWGYRNKSVCYVWFVSH